MKHETLCLHGGTQPDPTTNARAVPLYRTTSFVFDSTEHAANLFALKELGNIYSRIMNPTQAALEGRVALLEGAHEMAGLALSSGTSGVFYSIINLAAVGDNIVSARNLYGGSYTQFNDILPALGIEVKFVARMTRRTTRRRSMTKRAPSFAKRFRTRRSRSRISKPLPKSPTPTGCR